MNSCESNMVFNPYTSSEKEVLSNNNVSLSENLTISSKSKKNGQYHSCVNE